MSAEPRRSERLIMIISHDNLPFLIFNSSCKWTILEGLVFNPFKRTFPVLTALDDRDRVL